jgi:hypothetical protein
MYRHHSVLREWRARLADRHSATRVATSNIAVRATPAYEEATHRIDRAPPDTVAHLCELVRNTSSMRTASNLHHDCTRNAFSLNTWNEPSVPRRRVALVWHARQFRSSWPIAQREGRRSDKRSYIEAGGDAADAKCPKLPAHANTYPPQCNSQPSARAASSDSTDSRAVRRRIAASASKCMR